MIERRIEFGRLPARTTVEKKPHLPRLGTCEGYYKDGRRCDCPALFRDGHNRILCGRHYGPIERTRDQLEADKARYRDHHVVNYQSDMMTLPTAEVERIARVHRTGTIPNECSIYERLRLEARGEAAERELVRREHGG
jgi:hypothetical protein